MRILVVEDEQLLCRHLYTRLAEHGHVVDAVTDAEEGLYLTREFEFDVAIIDLGLPGMDGLDLIREVRGQGRVFPILVLTARGQWQDKVAGLTSGADDYMVKPFQFEELEARLHALVRRSSGFARSIIESDRLVVDTLGKQALLNGRNLDLTAYEYRILEYLVRHHQQVVPKERLAEQLHSDDSDRDLNSVEVLVGRLRRKLSGDGTDPYQPIDTIRGQGYLFTDSCR